MTDATDCRLTDRPWGVRFAGDPDVDRWCPADEPCDMHTSWDARPDGLEKDLIRLLNTDLATVMNEEDDRLTRMMIGDGGTGENLRGILNTPGIESVDPEWPDFLPHGHPDGIDVSEWPQLGWIEDETPEWARRKPANREERRRAFRGQRLQVGPIYDELDWSIDLETRTTAQIVSAFDVPARMVVPRTGPMYDTAAIVAAQDLEWKDRT